MKIELSFNNREESFVLPVPPPTIEISEASFNEKIRIVNLGEINLIGKRGLILLSISSFFPGKNSPHRRRATKESIEYKSLIQKWKRSGKPIRVIISDAEINLPMAIENFVYTVTEGSGDIKYTLELAEYRFLKASRVIERKIEPKTGLKERVSLKPSSKEHIVKPGDSLWAIAMKHLGDGNKFKMIYDVNKDLIDSRNQNAPKYTIYAGQRLVIPNEANHK